MIRRKRSKETTGPAVEAVPAVVAPEIGATSRRRAVRAPAPCPLCPSENPLRSEQLHLHEYESDQRDLLTGMIATTHAGADLAGPFCRRCLEKLERTLQRQQIVRVDDADHYIDLTLSEHPILPTPLRMLASPYYTGRGVTIAIVDSGFYPHPDLLYPSNRVVAAYDAVRGRNVPYPAESGDREPGVAAWHGTMTSVAAAGNGYLSGGRYRGIASDARLVQIRTMTPEYRIQTPQVVRALRWLRRNHERFDIRVVNLSLGVDETTDSLDHPVVALVEELVERGVVVVAASGNNPAQPLKPPGWAPSAITVGGYNDHNSIDWMRRELWHSSYGTAPSGPKPELLAPAIWIAAPILPRTAVKREAEALFRLALAEDDTLMRLIPEIAGDTAIASKLLAAKSPLAARSSVLRRIHDEKMINADYKHVDGTSFAAPIVSSIVAQLLEARPGLTPREVKEILTSTAAMLPYAPPEAQGYGIVQADRAMELALGLTPAIVPADVTVR